MKEDWSYITLVNRMLLATTPGTLDLFEENTMFANKYLLTVNR